LASDAIKSKVRNQQQQEKLDVVVQVAMSEYFVWQVVEVIKYLFMSITQEPWQRQQTVVFRKQCDTVSVG
jgi:hypothetical protein